MERQTILERNGWRFIRIRGSEYYRDCDMTMNRVIEELSTYGIEPEESRETVNEIRSEELLQRIKKRAHEILKAEQITDSIDMETISAALNIDVDAIENEDSVELTEKSNISFDETVSIPITLSKETSKQNDFLIENNMR
jgi:hypothetical protein